jgi:hypothetical protein
MKKVLLVSSLLLGLGLASSSYATPAAPEKEKAEKEKIVVQMQCPQSQMNLSKEMRSLWEDHVIYTRSYITAVLAGLPSADAEAQRLMQNQEEIGNAIKPYFGREVGEKFTSILREHITIASNVVKAAKENNKKALEATQKEWHDNAIAIAEFLSKTNPNWEKESLKKMLFKHLDLTTDEVEAILHKNWERSINTFDKGEAHMLKFADMLSDGIIKQFPNKFKE